MLHHGVSITIAGAAGAGRQTIYRWWPTKGAVVAEAMARHAQAPASGRRSPWRPAKARCTGSSCPVQVVTRVPLVLSYTQKSERLVCYVPRNPLVRHVEPWAVIPNAA